MDSLDLFTFEGHEVDPASADRLQWNMPRDFGPTVGQWMSEDHMRFTGDDESLFPPSS